MRKYMDCSYLALICVECQEYVWEIRLAGEAVKLLQPVREAVF
jgi:hypothetical protein